MKLKVDKKSDVLFFALDDSDIVQSGEVEPGVFLDFNAAGTVVGVELLNLSQRVRADRLRMLQFETLDGPAPRQELA